MRQSDVGSLVKNIGINVMLSVVLSLAMILAWGQYDGAEAQQSAPSKAGGRQKADLNLITTPIGSSAYTLAVGQGALLNKKAPSLKVSVQPAQGLALPPLLAKGEGHLVTIGAPTMYWAYRGEEDFTTPLPSLRMLQSGNDLYFGFVARSDTGIRSIEQLKGKKVIYDVPSTRLITKLGILQLQAYGLDPKKDVIAPRSETTTTAMNSLMDRRCDAIMTSLGGSKMAEAESRVGLRVLPFAENKVHLIRQAMPVFFGARPPAGMPGVTPDVPVVATAGVLVTNSDLDDSTAYIVVKTLVENYKELFPIHKDFYGWTPERAVRDLGIPYHPGAIKYYKEKDLWTNEMDKRQKQMLATGK